MGAPSALRLASKTGVVPLFVRASTSAPAESSARTTASEAYSAAWWSGLRPGWCRTSESNAAWHTARLRLLAFYAGPGVGVSTGSKEQVHQMPLVPGRR